MFKTQPAAKWNTVQEKELRVGSTADLHIDVAIWDSFCPLLTASWLAVQLPVWESRVGIAARTCAGA